MTGCQVSWLAGCQVVNLQNCLQRRRFIASRCRKLPVSRYICGMDKTHIVRIHHPSGQLYEAWCDFVENHPNGTFFQSDAVFRHAASWPEAEAVLLLLLDSSHKMHGSLLAIVTGGSTGLFARFTRTTLVYGGPVLAPRRRLQEHMNLDALLKALISEVKHRSASIRFVNMHDWSDHQPVFNGNGFSWSDGESLLLRLPNKAKAWDALSEECRQYISSSVDNGAVTFNTASNQQLQDFYALLQRTSSARARKALPPRSFFEALAKEWQGYFVLVEYHGRVVGGAVCPVVPGRLMQAWLVTGMDKELGRQGLYPGLLALWSAMELAIKHKVTYMSVLDRAVMLPGGMKRTHQLFGGDLLNYGRFVRQSLNLFL